MRYLLLALSLFFYTTQALADRLEQMISPAFHPVTFEDPRSISEARFLYVHHTIDEDFISAGGDVDVYALQLRYALNDRFALIATKDGFVDLNTREVVPRGNGLADIELGGKYAFFKDNEAGQIATGILRVAVPTGDEDVLQGTGDGELHPSVSAAYALTGSMTMSGDLGMRIPFDSEFSTFLDADVQVDYRIDGDYGAFYPLLGVSLIQVVDSGNRLPIADEGQDFFNLGAAESDGKSFVLGAAGLRYRPKEALDFGASFQFPLNPGSGTRILESRLLVDAIVRY